jgi:hypothetical protein
VPGAAGADLGQGAGTAARAGEAGANATGLSTAAIAGIVAGAVTVRQRWRLLAPGRGASKRSTAGNGGYRAKQWLCPQSLLVVGRSLYLSDYFHENVS